MKKYLLGIVAVVLAISFSAFTAVDKPVNSKGYSTLFWYYYDPVNDELDGEISLDRITHGAAQDATDCFDPENASVECARGYDEEQDPFDTEPGVGDDRVMKLPQ